jgi:hypothetical protein
MMHVSLLRDNHRIIAQHHHNHASSRFGVPALTTYDLCVVSSNHREHNPSRHSVTPLKRINHAARAPAARESACHEPLILHRRHCQQYYSCPDNVNFL